MKISIRPQKHGDTKRRGIVALCAAVLLVACAPMISGTLAYLMQGTPALVNTFVLGELNYELFYEANSPTEKVSDVQGMPDSPATGKIAGSEYTFTTNQLPTLDGYEFLGWSKNADATEAEYSVTDGQTSVTVEYDEDDKYVIDTATTTKTVYAVWKQMDFTVHFSTQVDGLTTNPASKTVTYLKLYGELPDPTRKGYTFTGWTLEPNGGTDITKDSIVTIAKDHILYAQWMAKAYKIVYHANGGTGTMEDQIIQYDKPTVLSKNEFTKSDYTFAGWALSSDGAVKYIDKQTVVNLQEDGTLDLYAVWIQDSHTVTFDYNGGYGSPESKQVQNGKAYGTLPTYPIHPTKTLGENKIMSYLFTGWYTAPTGGTRVYPSTIVNRTDDHVLYAQWKEAPTNNVIKDLVVKNNPDDNGDGVVDAFYVNFTCSSSYEKLNIPLENLVVGQKYKLSFTESNNATYGMNQQGYGNAIYGFIITTDGTLSPGSIKEESIADGGLIKDFEDRNDGELNGPRNWETTFTAEASVMYWTWDYGLILDGTPRDYNYTNIKLVPVEPEIEFRSKKLILHETSKAQVLNDSSSAYATNFVFDGDGYAETMYYPITGLTAGTTYSITFDHKFSGALIDSLKYDYGCGIMTAAPTNIGSKMDSLGDWASKTFVMSSVTGNTESVTLTFTATSNTAYWVWNMANASDSNNCTIDVKVTKFSATHAGGGSITYHSATSKANAVMLPITPPEMLPVELSYNVSIDELMPFSDTYPYVGVDYTMTFTPAEGYAMPEYVRVLIDGVEHLYISADLPKGVDWDGLECYILTIDGNLLANAKTLYIEAIAETTGVTYVIDLPGIEVSGTENTTAGQAGVLTLSGESLPKILTVEMKDTLNTDGTVKTEGMKYVTCLDEEFLMNTIKVWDAVAKIEWLTANEDGSLTLTISAGLMKDGEIITVTGKSYETYSLTDLTLEDLIAQ